MRATNKELKICLEASARREENNMRLIDADLLVENCKCTGKFEDNFKSVSLSDLRRVIGKQQTAYDVDKVVEQLEKLKDTEQDDSIAEKISTRNWNKAIQNAISIVKKGGAK